MATHREPILIAFDELITRLERKPQKLRQARALVVEALSDATPAKPSKGMTPKTIAPGSIPARVLEILGESKKPIGSTAITKAVKASYYVTLTHLNDLTDAGRIVRIGNGRNRTYQLKGGAK